MRSLFSRAYSPVNTGWSMVRMALLFGLFVCLFLGVFMPFGLPAGALDRWLIASCYGAITSIVMVLLNGIAPLLIKGWFTAERWTVGREMVWVLCTVGAISGANLLFSKLVGFVPITWGWALQFLGYTLAVAIFPVTLLVLLNERRLSKRYGEGSEHVNSAMASASVGTDQGQKSETAVASGSITIPSENGKEDISVAAGDLLFIRSAANYLEVYTRQGKKPGRSVIRGSLKAAELALADRSHLLRCHKSHLVNLDRVQRVSGNAQGYKLHLMDGVDPVPVSRSLNKRLEELLADRP